MYKQNINVVLSMIKYLASNVLVNIFIMKSHYLLIHTIKSKIKTSNVIIIL